MPRKCFNRKCILENCAYNLAINNFLSGLIALYHANIHFMLGPCISIGLGVLLILGVRKKDASILLSFFLMEALVLAFSAIETGLGVVEFMKGNNPNFNVFNLLVIIGVTVSWVLLSGVYILYKDFCKEKEVAKNGNVNSECKENNDESLKNVSV